MQPWGLCFYFLWLLPFAVWRRTVIVVEIDPPMGQREGINFSLPTMNSHATLVTTPPFPLPNVTVSELCQRVRFVTITPTGINLWVDTPTVCNVTKIISRWGNLLWRNTKNFRWTAPTGPWPAPDVTSKIKKQGYDGSRERPRVVRPAIEIHINANSVEPESPGATIAMNRNI